MRGPATSGAPGRGGEGEEPNEPPGRPCRVRIVGGARILDAILDEYKEKLYEYNDSIRDRGYYLKPVHKVYKVVGGERRLYEYYGRYWWRLVKTRNGRRLVYAGSSKPRGLPDPPGFALEGLSVIRVGDDVIVECWVYERYRKVLSGAPVEAVE